MGFFKPFKGDHPSAIGSGSSGFTSRAQQASSATSKRRHLFRNGEAPSPSQPSSSSYTAPPGAPPSAFSNPPPYHDWTSVPDTSLLPPPPSISHLNSPTNNASYDDAARARAWCDDHPLYAPSTPSPAVHDAAERGAIAFERHTEYTGSLKQCGAGQWRGQTDRSCRDTLLLSNIPLYFAATDSPLVTEKRKTVYFEVRVLRIDDDDGVDSAVAVGYCAKPYPSWRLPGWHRASWGVHGDDGRRFINDAWGGVDFVKRFEAGDVVGVGMNFCVGVQSERTATVKAEAFFTRNGSREGGWAIDEERDAERDEGVEGLQGEVDLYPAIGVFGAVEFEVLVGRESWMYRQPD